MPSTKEISWLAGILEGEGSFLYKKGSPLIQIQMTDQDVLENVAKLLNTRVSSYIHQPKGKPSYKPVYSCRLHGIKAIQWMMTILPLMGQRRRTKIKEVVQQWKASPAAPRASRGTRFMASCHPDQPRISKGLCRNCYMREYRKDTNV